VSELPTSQQVGKALQYLADTDESYARLTAAVKALEHKGKTIRATKFLGATGTVAEREAQSIASPEYAAFVEELENTTADREIEAARRKRAELTIAVWQSIGANRRSGQVI